MAQRSLFERIVHFLVQGVLGFWHPTSTARPLFSDPRRCFWIWDDLDHGPLSVTKEGVRLVLIFLFAGLWITFFAAAALVAFDREFVQLPAL